jgi:hypothetical protein
MRPIPFSDTYTVGRTPLDVGSARRRDLYLTTNSILRKQTSMPETGFQPIIPANERPQTHALDHATTGTGVFVEIIYLKYTE